MRRAQARSSNLAFGLVALLVVSAGVVLAFKKELPFRDHWTVTAAFSDASNIKPNSPVRIAGVDVGKVTSVDRPAGAGDAAEVTFRLDDEALPIGADARARIRPRTFLEGNYFVDLSPGTPASGRLEDGDVIPAAQTSTSVRFGDVLGALRSDVRADLRSLLAELDTAHEHGGAEGFNRSIPFWKPAYRDTAIVADALRGTSSDDLPRFLAAAATAAEAAGRDPGALPALVEDLGITAGALAREREALQRTVAELPLLLRAAQPALAALNDAMPPLRRLAVEVRPALDAAPSSLRGALPLLDQARRLLGPSELGGLVGELAAAAPAVGRLVRRAPGTLRQLRPAASCATTKLVPFLDMTIEDPDFPATGRIYEELPKSIAGIGGESRSGDANGQWLRVFQGSSSFAYNEGAGFLLTDTPLGGVNPPPVRSDAVFAPGVACETQELPDLRTRPAPPPSGFAIDQTSAAARALTARGLPVADRFVERLLAAAGDRTRQRVEPAGRLLERAEIPALSGAAP